MTIYRWSSIEWRGGKPYPRIHMHTKASEHAVLEFTSLREMKTLASTLAGAVVHETLVRKERRKRT